MPISVFNWDRQQQLLDPQAAMQAGSSRQLGASAAVSSAIKLLGVLNDYALQWRVQKELHDILPAAKSELIAWSNYNPTGKCYDSSAVGILLHLITAIGDAPLGMRPPRMFVALFTGDAGLDPVATLSQYLNTPIEYDRPDNMTIKYMFFWYTLDSTAPTIISP